MDSNQNTNTGEYIIIPNPIYDVVFRYLMDDNDSALIVLSTLINEKIKKLYYQPLSVAKKKTAEEYDEHIEKKKRKRFDKQRKKILEDSSLTDFEKELQISQITIKDPITGQDIRMMHLDFVAIIEKDDGDEEMVMIELQKVALETDIFRFKQYIAENFIKKRKVKKADKDTGQEIEVELPYRLIPIFILNFKIEEEICDLMIKTRQIKTGIFTDKALDNKNEFIDQLSYELYVVQLPYLSNFKESDIQNNEYKRKLYSLLKLFDQKEKKIDNEYRLRLFKRLFPGFLDRVIKRLQSADINNPDLEKQMQAEDYYLKPLMQRDNKISWLLANKKETEEKLSITAKQLDNTEKKLDNTEKQLDKEKSISKQKDKALNEKDKALNEKDKALNETKQTILKLAKELKSTGKTNIDIQELTGLTIGEIENL